MMRALCSLVFLASLISTPVFAGGLPAPIVGGSLPGLVMLSVVGVGYIALRRRNRRR